MPWLRRARADCRQELLQIASVTQGNLTQSTQDPSERGQLGGKQFARMRYSGVRNGGRNYYVILLAIDGNRMFELQAICHMGPESEEYQLLEAALLTFCEQ